MPSNYTPSTSATFTDTVPLPVGGDAPSAVLFRTPYERTLDNAAYLKRLLLDRPEQRCFVQDDFLNVDEEAIVFGTPRTWHGDTPWRVTQLFANPITLEQSGGSTNNHGKLRISATGGASGVNFSKFAGATSDGVSGSRILHAKCIMRAFEIDTGVKFEFGFQSSASGMGVNVANVAGASLLFLPATSANWLARTSLNAGSSTHLSDTGVPVTEGPGAGIQKLEIVREQIHGSVVEFRFYINDILVVTKNSGAGTFFLPGTNEKMQARFAAEVPDLTADLEYFEVDYVSFELNSSGR